MAQLTPVTFNEGEPLDVNKLNNLVTNVTNTYSTAAALQNATTTGTQTLLFDAGVVVVTTQAKTTFGSTVLPINPKFGTNIPSYVVSVNSDLANDEVVSLGIKTAKTAPAVVVNSNKLNKSYEVNWIAYLLQ